MARYEWFINRNKVQFLNNNGISLDTNSLVIELLDINKKFEITANNRKHRIDAIAKCKILDSKKYALFGVSIVRDKLYILRLNEKKEYCNDLVYKRQDFLSLCTNINRKLKG